MAIAAVAERPVFIGAQLIRNIFTRISRATISIATTLIRWEENTHTVLQYCCVSYRMQSVLVRCAYKVMLIAPCNRRFDFWHLFNSTDAPVVRRESRDHRTRRCFFSAVCLLDWASGSFAFCLMSFFLSFFLSLLCSALRSFVCYCYCYCFYSTQYT